MKNSRHTEFGRHGRLPRAQRSTSRQNQHNRSLDRNVYALNTVLPSIGDLPPERFHIDSLARYEVRGTNPGMAVGTINKESAIARRILILAAKIWRDKI